MKHIGDLVSRITNEKTRKTERGELMRYFITRLNASRAKDGLPLLSMARLGRILQGIPTKDLYYLQSVCNQSKHFSKKFWWEIDPKKHVTENPF